ncbi:MAG: TIGR00730 family Rossman fold protein [Alphaproteobacteria bacterium]|nr:TIGR00730 family Rossman fold protein [Alphaproteobacteria bacterium]
MRRICVYCGASDDVHERWLEAAREVGRLLAAEGIELVYGGGNVGLMGAMADACLDAGGRVLGVIPERLQALEVAHEGLTELFVVDSMHARKMLMAQLSDAFVALPGGFGTLEELFEALTWTQLGFHDKPVGVLDAHGYFAPLLDFVAQSVELGFVRPQHAALLCSAPTPTELLATLRDAHLPARPRWVLKP